MAKKIWYSAPLKVFWNDFYGVQKKITPELSDEKIYQILRRNLLQISLSNPQELQSAELMVSGLELWRKDSLGELLHMFFLDKELRDFLSDAPLSDLSGIHSFLFENGQQSDLVYFKIKSRERVVNFSFCLHIPYETEGYAFSLSVMENGTIELYFTHGKNNGRFSDIFYKKYHSKPDEKSKVFCSMFRLAINSIAYMNCFPECIQEGVPRITVDRNENRTDRNITFHTSEKIADFTLKGASKRPHFRKGHFKHLKSEYYTHKRGEIIYVAETMVKGPAKTVVSSPQKEKLNERSKGFRKESDA